MTQRRHHNAHVKGHPTLVRYVASNLTDNSVTLSIDGVQYEYFFAQDVRTSIAPKLNTIASASPGKALNWIKRSSLRCVRLTQPISQKVDP